MNRVYTIIFGGHPYDELKEPLIVTPDWEYVCITNHPFKSKVWEVQNIKRVAASVKDARFYKIMQCYGAAEKSIYLDGSFTINCDLNKFWDENFTSPMTVVKHPMRDCIYDEGEICIKNNRGNRWDIVNQCETYREQGMPRNFGLIQSGILMRENTEEVRNFCNLWWDQISLSTRDQIGFSYAEFKLGVSWPRIQLDYRTDSRFLFKTHKHRRAKSTNRNI